MKFLRLSLMLLFACNSWGKEPLLTPESIVASPSNGFLYIAEKTANRIAVFDSAQNKVLERIPVPDQPTGLALSKNGNQLVVTCSGEKHVLFLLDRKSNAKRTIPSGFGTRSPVFNAEEDRIYICNQFEKSISVFEVPNGNELKRIAVKREPFSAALSPDGNYLYVTHRLPDGPSNRDSVAATITVIHTKGLHVVEEISLPNGSVSVNDICFSLDGRYVFACHILAHYQLPTTQLEKGWINSNALSIIDTEKRQLAMTVMLDNVDRGAGNPWALECSGDGGYLFVTHAGTHEVSIINLSAMRDKLAGINTKPYANPSDKASADLSWMTNIRKRIALHGSGPRDLVLLGKRLYITNYFSDNLNVIEFEEGKSRQPENISFAEPSRKNKIERGEMLFHDATLCFQGWQSCASCHPDGRADGLNWDLLNDGIGNPKNTKSLLLSHQTPPSMSTGARGNAETAVRSGFHHILFVQASAEDSEAVDAYLTSLQPLSNPSLENPEMVEQGRTLFFSEKTKCASCHTGPYYTDLKTYDVGTSEPLARHHEFDNPTLRELWRTAPYLHDGKAATLRDVLTTYNHNDLHGITSILREEEIDAIEAFLLSL